MNVEIAVARYLAAAGVVDLDEDGNTGNAFIGHMPTSPDLAVMFNDTGGNPIVNDVREGYDEPTIQVMTRGGPYLRKEAKALAAAIYNELAGLHHITLDEGGDAEVYVVRVLATQSAPADLGRDDNERHRFSQNYSLHVRNTTAHRP